MFNIRLKELREERGLSQEQVAKAIKYTQSNLAKWERKIHDPPTDAVTALAIFFNVTTDYLLGLEDDFGKSNYPIENQHQNKKEKALLEEMKGLDDYQLEYLRGVIAELHRQNELISNHKKRS